MCISCYISANVRQKMGVVIGILNCLIALFGLALICLAIHMKVNIESRMMLLDGYDTGVLPNFLLAVGIKTVVFHVVTFKIVYDCSSSGTSGRCINILFLAVILSFILVWFLLGGGLACFDHLSVIEESFQNGFAGVMKKYKTDLNVKVTLDKLQQEYHCCGSNGYGDWFSINWVNEEFLNTNHPDVVRKLKGGLFYSDDVPYSCCDVTSPRPCIHHSVNDKSLHVHYGDVTLYKTGCTEALMDFFEHKVIIPTGWVLIVAFILQFVTMVLMRLLQTSLVHAHDMEDVDGEGLGYCMPNCPCKCCSTGDPMKYLRKKKHTDDDVEDGGGQGGADFEGTGGSKDKKDKDSKKDKEKDKEKGKDKGKDKDQKNKKEDKDKKKEAKTKNEKDKKSKCKSESTKGKGSPKSKTSPKAKKSPKKTVKKPKSPKKRKR